MAASPWLRCPTVSANTGDTVPPGRSPGTSPRRPSSRCRRVGRESPEWLFASCRIRIAWGVVSRGHSTGTEKAGALRDPGPVVCALVGLYAGGLTSSSSRSRASVKRSEPPVPVHSWLIGRLRPRPSHRRRGPPGRRPRAVGRGPRGADGHPERHAHRDRLREQGGAQRAAGEILDPLGQDAQGGLREGRPVSQGDAERRHERERAASPSGVRPASRPLRKTTSPTTVSTSPTATSRQFSSGWRSTTNWKTSSIPMTGATLRRPPPRTLSTSTAFASNCCSFPPSCIRQG